jgi:sec-independent protein translocase protein TatA
MGGFSLIHWIILGVVILLLFGGNRFSAMMGDVAKGLKSFKQGMAEDETPRPGDTRQIPPQQPTQASYQQQPPQQQPTHPQTIDLEPQPQPRTAEPQPAPPPRSDDQAR